jgi:hypothetical protein
MNGTATGAGSSGASPDSWSGTDRISVTAPVAVPSAGLKTSAVTDSGEWAAWFLAGWVPGRITLGG